MDQTSPGEVNLLVTSLDSYELKQKNSTASARGIRFVSLPTFSEEESLSVFEKFKPLSMQQRHFILLCCGHPRSLLAMKFAFEKYPEKNPQIEPLLSTAVRLYKNTFSEGMYSYFVI